MSNLLSIPLEGSTGDRLRWLIKLRWAGLGFGLLVTLAADALLDGALPQAGLLATVAVAAAYNLAFLYVLRRLGAAGASPEAYETVLHAQFAADLIALTAMLHFSGGLENPFSAYYVLLVGAGCIMMSRGASLVYAGAASLFWAGLIIGEAAGVLPHHNLVGFRSPLRYQEPLHVITEIVVMTTANAGVAIVASTIVSRLRQGEMLLLQANADCEARSVDLAGLNDRLREQDQERTMFVRLITHELRAPVAAIKSYLRLILEGYVAQDGIMEVVAKSEQRATDQLDLIQDLLDFARAQQPHEDLQLVDIAAVLDDVLEMMQPRVKDQGLTLTVEKEAGRALVIGLEDQIRQLWTNLISNAVKYTPSGGKVWVTLSCDDGVVCGTVTDTGIGIKPEELAHVFESFYRAEAAKAISRHGTGLGLSIVKEIVERCGGHIDVRSEYGNGSTFTFKLPQQAETVPLAHPS